MATNAEEEAAGADTELQQPHPPRHESVTTVGREGIWHETAESPERIRTVDYLVGRSTRCNDGRTSQRGEEGRRARMHQTQQCHIERT